MLHIMIVVPQESHLSAEQRRVLEILAAAGLRGCDGATLLADRFRIDTIADLVHDGLASARCKIIKLGKRQISVARIRITDAGRKAIEH